MVNQLGMASPPRWLLSGLLVALMMGVMIAGQRIMMIATKWLVYPLMAILLGVSVYLVPSWQVGSLLSAPVPSAGDLAMSVWMVIPVLVFAFSFAAAISQFSVAMRGQYGTDAPAKASSVMLRTTVLLVLCTMGFVWSCVLALGPDGLAAARESNLPVLSYLANVHDSPFISYLGPATTSVPPRVPPASSVGSRMPGAAAWTSARCAGASPPSSSSRRGPRPSRTRASSASSRPCRARSSRASSTSCR